MAFDLNDEELQATREMNKTAWESEIDKWSKEYLIERYKNLVEIEKEHKKENGELREEVTHWKGKYHLENRRYLDLYDKKISIPIINATEEMLQQYIEKSKILEKIEKLDLIIEPKQNRHQFLCVEVNKVGTETQIDNIGEELAMLDDELKELLIERRIYKELLEERN